MLEFRFTESHKAEWKGGETYELGGFFGRFGKWSVRK